MTVPTSGLGSASPLAPPPNPLFSNLQGVALVSGTLYFADNGDQAVAKVVLSTSAETVLEQNDPDFPPFNVAADSTYVYYGGLLFGGIYRVPLAGGAPSLVSASITPNNGQFGVAVDANDVYWADCGNQCALLRAPIAGGSATTVDPGPVGEIVAVDGSRLYWESGGMLVTAPVTQGVPGAVVTLAQVGGPMVLDSSTVYWETANAIMKIAK
jgi:hypothetical protein